MGSSNNLVFFGKGIRAKHQNQNSVPSSYPLKHIYGRRYVKLPQGHSSVALSRCSILNRIGLGNISRQSQPVMNNTYTCTSGIQHDGLLSHPLSAIVPPQPLPTSKQIRDISDHEEPSLTLESETKQLQLLPLPSDHAIRQPSAYLSSVHPTSRLFRPYHHWACCCSSSLTQQS